MSDHELTQAELEERLSETLGELAAARDEYDELKGHVEGLESRRRKLEAQLKAFDASGEYAGLDVAGVKRELGKVRGELERAKGVCFKVHQREDAIIEEMTAREAELVARLEALSPGKPAA